MSPEDLLAPFHLAETPRDQFRVGTEAEKFGVVRKTGRALPFELTEGSPSVQAVLADLVERHGWKEKTETQEGPAIALIRGQSSITLEPGGQLELSGAAVTTIHETCAEFREHMDELEPISDELGLAWLGVGFHPLAKQAELSWVPKLRYGVMREYLPTKGTFAEDMMRRTSTVQANYDFLNEDDAMRKLRVSLKVSPIVTAMFANSPFIEGKATGERSHRARVWTSVDPDRSGYLEFAWSEDARYQDYVDWVLRCPMFLILREGKVLRNTGQTFQDFLDNGYEGHRATAEDWQTHLNTMFPEVRLKQTLEVRGADSQSADMVCALPAIWKGILYDDEALDEVEELSRALTFNDAVTAQLHIADRGLQAEYGGKSLTGWAEQLLAASLNGLERIGHKNAEGKDERIHLDRLSALVERGRTPADELLEGLSETPSTAELIRRTAL